MPGELTGAGGVRLTWWAYFPQSAVPPRAVLLLAHGYAEHHGRYDRLIAALTEAGFAVCTLDHQGHGRSAGRRATIGRFDTFVDDLRRIDEQARAAYPATPIFLFGHSMGGLIALRYSLRYQDDLHGLALSAPAVRFGEDTPAFLRRLAGLIARIVPNLPVPGPRTGGESLLSRDPTVQAAFDADPLNYHGPVRAQMAHQMLQAATDTRARLATLRLPLLVMQGDRDRYVMPAGAAELYERSGSADKTLRSWPDCRHELLNEPEGPQVQAYLLDWLDQRLPPARD